MALRAIRRAKHLSVVTVGLLLVLLPAPVPAAASVQFTPGAAGVGDPYYPTYGNGGYDAIHYDLDIRYDPASDVLTGRMRLTARATQHLSSFNLDLLGLHVDAASVDGRAAGVRRDGSELTITPSRGIVGGRLFLTEIRYHGVPATFVLPGTPLQSGFMHTDDGAVIAGQPEVAAAWYPVNDHPLDKASYTFAVTVPDGLAAICNGLPLGRATSGGWTTWWWAQFTPMISYLATATIGRFRVHTTLHNGRPMVVAVDSDLPVDLADDAVNRTGEITDFLAARFGPYPFEANGAIVDDYDNLFFALENQTRSIYSKYWFESGVGETETYVVAHEVAHQWFGDSVGVRHWKDIWLNESFATYAEWLWSEHVGHGTPQEIFDFLYEEPLTRAYWAPSPGDPGVDELFDDSVYVRGAMTLHALRLTVGDEAFWRLVRLWAADKRNGNGSTEEFIGYAEQVSGKQLDDLFSAWLYTEGRPDYPGFRMFGPKLSKVAWFDTYEARVEEGLRI